MPATEVPNEHPVRQFARAAEEQLKQARTNEEYARVRHGVIRSANEFFDSSDIVREIHDALPDTYEAFREIHSGG